MSIKVSNEELRQIYEDIPPSYDRANRFMSFNQDVRWRGDLVKTILRYCAKPKLILDVAGGKGELTYVFKKIYKDQVFSVITDYSENMLKLSIVEDDKILASFDALPFRDSAFDVVMSSFALHASDNIEKVIEEMNRISKKVIGFIAMGKPDNKIKQLYISIYLKSIMPYIAIFARGKPKDYKYIYYIYKKLPTNSFYKELFYKLLNVKVYEEKGLNLFYFVVATKKESSISS
ncbi:methyltransferase domain-containing protein [Acidianus sulfidivorans JP7]|uniref:Methyltransferase type 11 n=1 Tax=Acidianus sulfidivorans JP7 TaxID=619593 RepID=A0A2U9IL84_9CREN|nr:class I SAM-dependent methyltransferase [Acidianus sulfidivorans]AWR96808.1 methyltransferase domain-containing protein [Acidianus sulfidivorans JP7]